jgi:hypothetical protein
MANPDWVYFGQNPPAFVATDTLSCSYRVAGALFSGGPVAMPNVKRYLGSLNVRVGDDAEGEFEVAPLPNTPDGLGSYLRDAMTMDIGPLAIEPVSIMVAGVPPVISVMGSDPPSGIIDARQPSNLAGTVLQGFTEILLHFNGPTAGLTSGDFTVTTFPPGAAPDIALVGTLGSDALIVLEERIPPGRWTRIRHNASATCTTIGFLPADVTQDRFSGPTDILAEINCINNVPNLPHPCEEYNTDSDRSGLTNPQDILGVINLLNGASAFDMWNGQQLPPPPVGCLP